MDKMRQNRKTATPARVLFAGMAVIVDRGRQSPLGYFQFAMTALTADLAITVLTVVVAFTAA